MKTNIKTLREKVSEVREKLANSTKIGKGTFGNNKEEQLLNDLFKDVESAVDLESYIWDTVDGFTRNELSTEEIFLSRKDSGLSDKISEILGERDNTLKGSSVSDMDNLLNDAGFRYMLSITYDIEQELLQVYILNNLLSVIFDLDDNLELDASEYGAYNDEESLLEDFIDELISSISGDEKIIQIEDVPKNTLIDFFELEI